MEQLKKGRNEDTVKRHWTRALRLKTKGENIIPEEISIGAGSGLFPVALATYHTQNAQHIFKIHMYYALLKPLTSNYTYM